MLWAQVQCDHVDYATAFRFYVSLYHKYEAHTHTQADSIPNPIRAGVHAISINVHFNCCVNDTTPMVCTFSMRSSCSLTISKLETVHHQEMKNVSTTIVATKKACGKQSHTHLPIFLLTWNYLAVCIFSKWTKLHAFLNIFCFIMFGLAAICFGIHFSWCKGPNVVWNLLLSKKLMFI